MKMHGKIFLDLLERGPDNKQGGKGGRMGSTSTGLQNSDDLSPRPSRYGQDLQKGFKKGGAGNEHPT